MRMATRIPGRRRFLDAPLLITGFAGHDVRQAANGLGAEVLAKPSDAAALRSQVRRMVDVAL